MKNLLNYTDYEVEIDRVTQYAIDSSEMYPQYYIEDPLGEVKLVYQMEGVITVMP